MQLTTTRIAVAIAIVYVAAMFSYYQGFHRGQNHPPCYEDEAYFVQLDTNPEHGLTWGCQNLEQAIAGIMAERT